MSKVELLIFRHGETDWNLQLKFQGHTDIPLNKTGWDQARELAPLMNKYKPQVILTSDLIRAQETAEAANIDIHVPIVISKELRETNLGDAEGLHRDKVIDQYGHERILKWRSIKKEDLDFSFPNGETKAQHRDRMTQYISSFCLANPQYHRIGVSTHGGSLHRLIHHCEGAPGEDLHIPNCSLFRIYFEPSSDRWFFGENLRS